METSQFPAFFLSVWSRLESVKEQVKMATNMFEKNKGKRRLESRDRGMKDIKRRTGSVCIAKAKSKVR